MNESQHKDRLLEQMQSSLDQSVDDLDDATLRELRRARYAAVQASQKRASWLLPVGGLATAATVAVFSVSLWLASPPPGVNDVLLPLDDLALLGDAESLEFYEELDFYLWLEDEKDAG